MCDDEGKVYVENPLHRLSMPGGMKFRNFNDISTTFVRSPEGETGFSVGFGQSAIVNSTDLQLFLQRTFTHPLTDIRARLYYGCTENTEIGFELKTKYSSVYVDDYAVFNACAWYDPFAVSLLASTHGRALAVSCAKPFENSDASWAVTAGVTEDKKFRVAASAEYGALRFTLLSKNLNFSAVSLSLHIGVDNAKC